MDRNILLYIDPGTGSMLFAILIGVIGTLNYVLKNWIVKLRFTLSSGKKVETNADKIPFVIFSDDKRYWNIFDPICREFDRRGVDVVYMTASPDDPALENPYEHIRGEFIGKNNKAFARMNFLNAGIVFSTTPGLDVYQWKRSKDVQYYVHILHGANDVTGYRMFGVDYYDGILLSGEYQVQQVRDLEKLRDLPAKDVVKVGIPYMDEMTKRLEAAPVAETGGQERTVLLAPTWGKSSIFQKYGGKILEVLLQTGYHIIVRPHPQSFTSEKEMLEKLMQEYPASDQLEWNRDNDNFDVLKRTDILISDFSGIVFEFAFVYDKPVIYADTEYDSSPYDAWWLDTPFWTFTALPRIGQKLTMDNLDNLKEMIDECIQEPKYAEGRREACGETWEHRGEGAKRAVDFLMQKYEELTQEEKGA